DKGLAIPTAHGISPPRREPDFGTRTAVGEDLAEPIEFLKKDNGQSGVLNDLERNRWQHRSGYALWPATLGRRTRALSLQALLIELQCRGPEWNLLSIYRSKLQVLI